MVWGKEIKKGMEDRGRFSWFRFWNQPRRFHFVPSFRCIRLFSRKKKKGIAPQAKGAGVALHLGSGTARVVELPGTASRGAQSRGTLAADIISCLRSRRARAGALFSQSWYGGKTPVWSGYYRWNLERRVAIATGGDWNAPLRFAHCVYLYLGWRRRVAQRPTSRGALAGRQGRFFFCFVFFSDLSGIE